MILHPNNEKMSNDLYATGYYATGKYSDSGGGESLYANAYYPSQYMGDITHRNDSTAAGLHLPGVIGTIPPPQHTNNSVTPCHITVPRMANRN